MKRCYICKTEKELPEFYKASGKPDGHQSGCKSCTNALKQAEQTHKRKVAQRYKVIKGCRECGYKEHFAALDFAHRDRSQKRKRNDNYKRAVDFGWSWKKIKEEIAKCDVLCARCHRIETWKENNEGTS